MWKQQIARGAHDLDYVDSQSEQGEYHVEPDGSIGLHVHDLEFVDSQSVQEENHVEPVGSIGSQVHDLDYVDSQSVQGKCHVEPDGSIGLQAHDLDFLDSQSVQGECRVEPDGPYGSQDVVGHVPVQEIVVPVPSVMIQEIVPQLQLQVQEVVAVLPPVREEIGVMTEEKRPKNNRCHFGSRLDVIDKNISHEWEQMNKYQPLWMREPEDVTNDEYASLQSAPDVAAHMRPKSAGREVDMNSELNSAIYTDGDSSGVSSFAAGDLAVFAFEGVQEAALQSASDVDAHMCPKSASREADRNSELNSVMYTNTLGVGSTVVDEARHMKAARLSISRYEIIKCRHV